MAAVEEERPGFISPWMSSHAVNRLLEEKGFANRVPRNRRRQLIESLGYVRHPFLQDGRTNNAVMPDGARTTLFVKKDHLALQIESPQLIAETYNKAQTKQANCPFPVISQTS